MILGNLTHIFLIKITHHLPENKLMANH